MPKQDDVDEMVLESGRSPSWVIAVLALFLFLTTVLALIEHGRAEEWKVVAAGWRGLCEGAP